ncbi:MAG TPA: S8 family serine peptidase, partial [Solirubrobacteraceae bacterium]
TASVDAAPPVAAALPVVTGWPEAGESLAVDGGTWTGTAPIALSYQWQRCDVHGLECVDVAGATEATYVPTEDDVGATLRATVAAANAGGTVSAASEATLRIASATGFSSRQQWPYVTGVARFWAADAPAPPAIAIVDSGIDATRPDFGGRVVAQASLTALTPNSPGDGRGHGTFVASIAAGEAHGYTGAAPRANLVSVDVIDDHGMAMTSDVIAAADWIYQNRDTYNIRVANFSLQGSAPSSLQVDPVDKAVERLWQSGVVVVAAAGNYGSANGPSGVLYSPGNDPFVLTAGALDTQGTVATGDDLTAPWSAYGHTLDGFLKPELGAPGRYIVGAVPPDSTLALERPESIVAPGYMRLSGTSFAAPVVSGAAADVLAAHPSWTPNQVKGALMLTAAQTADGSSLASGAGEVDAAAAADAVDPPNPNAALDQFLVADPAGGPTPVFDTTTWAATAQADPSWATAYWGTAYWGTAYWGTAYWGTAYWGTDYWETGSALSSSDAYWGTTSVTATPNGAVADALPAGAYWISAADRVAAEGRLGLAP